MRKKILWIEDGAFDEIAVLATPVHLTGEYQLEFALDASQAIRQLESQEFDAVIVDIRILPGDDPKWLNMYYATGSNKAARLGVKLLQFLLGTESESYLFTGGS
jgi:DNA-binding NtrC family response regulator